MGNKPTLIERMRKVALDIPDDMTNREYWIRTNILEWVDELEAGEKANEQRIRADALSNSLRAVGL